MSVRELQESQKMLCKLILKEHSLQSSTDTAVNDERIDLWTAKIEVYEVIKPMGNGGSSYRMRCLH